MIWLWAILVGLTVLLASWIRRFRADRVLTGPQRRLMRRRITMAAGLYGLLLLCTILASTGCTDLLFLHPTTDARDPHGAVSRMIDVGGLASAEVWIARSPGTAARGVDARPDIYVLQFTGNDMRAEEMAMPVAQTWGDRPAEVWAVNFPGFGQSAGPTRLHAIPPMALAAFDALERESHGRPIVVAGRSIGTTAALYVASHRSAAGVVLQNPPVLKQIVLRQFGWWNLWLLAGPVALSIPDELDSLAGARACRVPAIFITADADNKVIPKYQQHVIDAYAGPSKRIDLANKGHEDSIDRPDELRDLRAAYDWMMSGQW